ncbi:MAG TPA: glycosyltransferase, partial [Acidimicrobiia bacterium]
DIPHLTSIRGTDLSRGLFHAGRFALVRHTIESATGITFVNEYLSRLAHLAFRLPRISEIVPNGVCVSEAPHDHTAVRTSLRTQYAIPGEQPVLGFVGWARPKKGLEDLLDALAAVERTSPHLLIIGDFLNARDRGTFVDRARRLGLTDRVAVTGPLEHRRVRELLPAVDAVVIPSWDDGMPNVLLEAMERGVAVFGSDVMADVLVHGCNGFLFERHDVAELARLLDRVLWQPDVLAAVGSAARQTVIERFDYSYERDAYLRIYESLLSAPSAS